jgi:hypothetical protein
MGTATIASSNHSDVALTADESSNDLTAKALVLLDEAGGAVRVEPERDEVELPATSELALLSEVLQRLVGPLGEAR